MGGEILRSVAFGILFLAAALMIVLNVWVFRIFLKSEFFRETMEKLRQRGVPRRMLAIAGLTLIVAVALFGGTVILFPESRDPWRMFIVGLLSIMAARLVLMVGKLLWHTVSGRGQA